MEIGYTDNALKDIAYWKSSGNKKISGKITELIKSIHENPRLNDAVGQAFTGIGKPEPLRYDFSGYWSRRIDKEHRIVYSVEKNRITIMSARFHY